MNINLPTWDSFMIPILKAMESGEVFSRSAIFEKASTVAQLTHEQISHTLPSGRPTAEGRVGWAISYLSRTDLIERVERGKYRITKRGQQALQDYPEGITDVMLRQYAKRGDQWWIPKGQKPSPQSNAHNTPSANLDPTEQIETGIQRIHQDVARELLTRLQEQEPVFFEHTVVELLLKMGYGGAHGRGAVTQLSHDGGIDGVIDQDALGLNKVYVQAKRYESKNSVGRREVQEFVGALSGRADGGLLITTSRFTASALDYAETIPTRIILIDGDQLANLMIRYEVGVEIKQTYNVVAIDEDFFV